MHLLVRVFLFAQSKNPAPLADFPEGIDGKIQVPLLMRSRKLRTDPRLSFGNGFTR